MVAFTWSALPGGAASRWSLRRSGVDLNWGRKMKARRKERERGKIRPEVYMWVRMEQRWQLRDMASQNEEQHFRPEEWSRKKKKSPKAG